MTAPGFDPRTVLADFLERYKARFDIELPEMTAMLVNLRTIVIEKHLLYISGLTVDFVDSSEERGFVFEHAAF